MHRRSFLESVPKQRSFHNPTQKNLRGADIMQHVNSDFESKCLIPDVEFLNRLNVRILLLNDSFLFFTSIYFVYISLEDEVSGGMVSFVMDLLSTISYSFKVYLP